MKLILTIFLIITLNRVFCQSDEKHKIDIELQNCLDSTENQTTKGMTDCVINATQKWDDELNVNYKNLLNLLTQVQKDKLIIAQREWIEYRNKEIEFSNQVYSDLQGTMWITVSAETNLDLTRKRAQELASYISNLTIDK